EEAPRASAADPGTPDSGSVFVLPLSARSPEALRTAVTRWQQWLPSSDSSLADTCYTAAVRRTHHPHRVAVTGPSKHGRAERLTAPEVLELRRVHKLAFVFARQGAQWAGMGRDLYASEPVFRETFDRCGGTATLLDAESLPDETALAQPLLFALEAGLVAL